MRDCHDRDGHITDFIQAKDETEQTYLHLLKRYASTSLQAHSVSICIIYSFLFFFHFQTVNWSYSDCRLRFYCMYIIHMTTDTAGIVFLKIFIIYIWLHQVLVAACGIFTAVHRLSSCGPGVQLPHGMWDLISAIRD